MHLKTIARYTNYRQTKIRETLKIKRLKSQCKSFIFTWRKTFHHKHMGASLWKDNKNWRPTKTKPSHCWRQTNFRNDLSENCRKSVRIMSYSGPYFPAFGLNTERYSVSLPIQSECGKIRTRITFNMDTFYAVGFYYVRRQLRITEPKYHKKRNIRLIRLRFWCTIKLFKGVLIKKTDFFENNDVTLSWRVIKRSKLWKKIESYS